MAAAVALSGCVSTITHGVSNIDSARSARVLTSVSGLGIFHITEPDLDAAAALAGQCGSGGVTGVETHASVRDYLFVQDYTVAVSGYCTQ